MIHRAKHNKENAYITISKRIIESKELSDAAVRLLLFMLSKPDDFSFSIKGLAYLLGWPESKVVQHTAELKSAGYIKNKRCKNKIGQFQACEWDVYEAPTLNKNHSVEKPQCGKTTTWKNHSVDQPHCGSTTVRKKCSEILSNDINLFNDNKLSNDREVENKKFTPPSLEEVRAYCLERNNSVNPIKFFNHYESVGWKVGKNSMKDWKAAVRKWEQDDKKAPERTPPQPIRSKYDIDWDAIEKGGQT